MPQSEQTTTFNSMMTVPRWWMHCPVEGRSGSSDIGAGPGTLPARAVSPPGTN